MITLAYTPFIDPLNAHDWWFLLILPLTLFIAIAYKSVRVSEVKNFWPNVLTMWVQTILGIAGLAVCAWVLIELVIPLLTPVAP